MRVNKHKRRIAGKWRSVKGYSRKQRPKGKKRKVDKKPVRLYAVRDEYGRILGYKSKRGR